MTDTKCPICQTNAELIEPPGGYDYGRHKGYNCPVCGPYFITGAAEAIAMNKIPAPRLSAWIREHQENNLNPPEITRDILENVLNKLPVRTPLEKHILLLRAIERRTEYPGAEVLMTCESDYPLAYAKNCDELKFFCNALKERKLIFLDQERIKVGLIRAVILPDGWDYLDKHSLSPAFKDRAFVAMSFDAFVAMSFDKVLEPAWENGIKPAIERAGYKPHRVDKDPHIDRIDARIIADIKDSLFMIADVTQQKQGVYFEAGYALGLNKSVIWCVNKKHLKKVHFDTRQFNHIVWETPEDLQEKLYNVICAVIGKRNVSEM